MSENNINNNPAEHPVDKAAERRAQQRERMEELKATIAQGVQDVFEPDKYQAFLRTVSRFPDYSFNNQMLLAVQHPDATKVMTYGDWEKQGRNVSKGEKGSKIIRPRQSTQTVDGKPTTRTFFNIVTVFDVAQTTGKPQPEPVLPNVSMLKDALNRISTEVGDLSVSAGIRKIAYDTLLQRDRKQNVSHTEARINQIANEADSIAYAVGTHYGFQMDESSLQSAAEWLKGQELPVQRAMLESVSKTTGNFVLSIDHHLRHIQQEREAEMQRATEWLYNLDDSYLVHIQPCDSGYDYTIYSAHTGQLLDGGQMDMSIPGVAEVLQEIIKAHELPTLPPEVAAPELLASIHEDRLPRTLEQNFMSCKTDSFAIYQLRDADENTALRFMSHDYAQQKNQTINHSRYALAYTADLLQDASKTLNDHLNELYYRFNQDHPEDFRGHSLSVSDVVAIRHQGELTCMYVDSFGFKPLPDFYADNPLRTAEMSMEDDMNLLDGRINNGRSDAVKAELPDERRPSVHDQLRKPPAHADKPKKSVQNHAEMEL